MKFSDVSETISKPAPTLGQHTEEVLSFLLGMDAERIKELKNKNIIK